MSKIEVADLEFLLDWLDLCHGQRGSRYQGIEPLHPEFIGLMMDDPGRVIIDFDSDIRKLATPLDITLFHENLQEAGAGGHIVNHITRLDNAAINRLFHRYHEIVVRNDIEIIRGDGRKVVSVEYFSLIGGEWSAITKRRNPDPRAKKDFDRMWGRFVQAAVGLAATRMTDWRVNVGRENGASVSVATDPTGLRELFKSRDYADGLSRRTALQHWVKAHWRKRRSDESDLTFVRGHLRGARQFVWNGLKCSVFPPPDEVKRSDVQLVPGV